ncbi:MAG: nucleotide exchange factor GrpE [Myxococcota bacterium]
MSDSKGPKISLPEELAAELDSKGGGPGPSADDTSDAASGQEATAESSEELEEIKDRYLRLGAEFENYKRRTLKERESLFNYGNENLIKELLETVDNLERALGHAEEGLGTETLLEGVELTHRSLMRALEKFGVERVDAKGEQFDPKVHEAIRQVETEDHSSGTVAEVYQTGYLLKDRLLRPALVGVACRPKGTSEDPE